MAAPAVAPWHRELHEEYLKQKKLVRDLANMYWHLSGSRMNAVVVARVLVPELSQQGFPITRPRFEVAVLKSENYMVSHANRNVDVQKHAVKAYSDVSAAEAFDRLKHIFDVAMMELQIYQAFEKMPLQIVK